MYSESETGPACRSGLLLVPAWYPWRCWQPRGVAEKARKADAMRVLIADSHVTVRTALRRLLDQEPELSLAGEVGRLGELLAQAQSVGPDVVLVEWELPGMPLDGDATGRDGTLQARRRLVYLLHTLPQRPHVVALSGWPQAQKAALLAGVDAFVSKGDPPRQLLATLRDVAGERKSRRMGPHTLPAHTADVFQPEVGMKIKNYRKVKAEQLEPGITLRWLIGELDDAPNFALKLVELDSEVISPVYTHPWEDEVFVLRGSGALLGPEGEVAIGEGDVIYIPSMERHQFANRGERELCLLMSVPIAERMSLASGVGA
jgi:DNA-binding NarL/FixJ family response regulator